MTLHQAMIIAIRHMTDKPVSEAEKQAALWRLRNSLRVFHNGWQGMRAKKKSGRV